MNTQTSNSICPKCGAPIAEGAPQGLCPKCVLLGVATAAKPRGKEGHAPAPHEIAPHFPELEVLELIGVGGMGAVYKARQTKLGRLVALKVLSNSLADDPEFLERFEREARVLGRLNHPGIVTVFDSGMAGPCAYLLMEYVDGVNLRQAMQSGGFTPREALAVTQEICSALEYAHGQGILHRDIKPENILIDGTGRVKIADFGIAKLVGDQGPDHATLTMKGAVLGSMSYMAPEQFDAPGDVDQRADIYSLGVVLYELLTGELPRGRFGPPSDKSAVDARIDEIVMRTLEREREARFQNVHQMKTQMDAATQPGIAPAPASGPASERKTARFATASLICTILAIPLAFILSVSFFFSSFTERGQHMNKVQDVSLATITLRHFLFGIMVLPGTMLGMRALREIHVSGGKLAGLDRATFSVLLWPVLLVLIFAIGGISTLFADNGVATVWRILLAALLLAASGLGIVMIVRVLRWKKDPRPAAAGISTHVWRFTAAAVVAAVCVFAYVREESATRKEYFESSGTTSTWKLRLVAGKMVKFRVFRADAAGKETPVGISGNILSPVDKDFLTTLKITSQNPWKGNSRHQLTASYNAYHGQESSRTVFLDDRWTFGTSGNGASTMFAGEKDRVELASRYDWLGRKAETLYIELVAAPQSDDGSNAGEKQP